MKLRRVRRVRWDILAVCDDRGECQLLEFLEEWCSSGRQAGYGMLALLARTAEHGPSRNKELYDNLGDGIYEMRKAGLRVLYFYDGGRVIVCSHAYKKQSQRIGHGEKERACSTRDKYFAAKSRGELEILDP